MIRYPLARPFSLIDSPQDEALHIGQPPQMPPEIDPEQEQIQIRLIDERRRR